ncbi:MAG: hypothetical protein H6Q15_774 [Bacteroidetes bacterium]|nr:hypothetical protein [Bacteroidota bacterium]
MKKILIALAFISISFVSCNKNKEKAIIGKWQNVMIITQYQGGSDSLDMKKAKDFTTFREDKTLYITNGKKEANSNYFIRENTLYSFKLGGMDTNRMEIIMLNSKKLSLKMDLPNFENSTMILNYERVD